MSEELATWVITWRHRDNSASQLTLSPGKSREEAEEEARAFGWPGHSGSRWEYFKDDLRAWWRVFR
jgi:hypothetical protein